MGIICIKICKSDNDYIKGDSNHEKDINAGRNVTSGCSEAF